MHQQIQDSSEHIQQQNTFHVQGIIQIRVIEVCHFSSKISDEEDFDEFVNAIEDAEYKNFIVSWNWIQVFI